MLRLRISVQEETMFFDSNVSIIASVIGVPSASVLIN
jgi:hypothetical protein